MFPLQIMWTGDKVISKVISRKSLEELAVASQRPAGRAQLELALV